MSVKLEEEKRIIKSEENGPAETDESNLDEEMCECEIIGSMVPAEKVKVIIPQTLHADMSVYEA